MSYWFCKVPAVGASGAIFGLVGSYAMFVLRHRGMVKGTEGDLKHIAQVIVLNMTIGLLSQGIDNWGHVGGLIGGAAASWLLGPAWEFESVSNNGRKTFRDNAPISSLIKGRPKIDRGMEDGIVLGNEFRMKETIWKEITDEQEQKWKKQAKKRNIWTKMVQNSVLAGKELGRVLPALRPSSSLECWTTRSCWLELGRVLPRLGRVLLSF